MYFFIDQYFVSGYLVVSKVAKGPTLIKQMKYYINLSVDVLR